MSGKSALPIRDLRESRGMTQARLAQLTATSQPQIRRLEAGERRLTKDWAERLAPHLGVSALELMFGEDAYDPPSPVGLPGAKRNADPPVAAALSPEMQDNASGSMTSVPPTNARLGAVVQEPRSRIPVFGQAVGGANGEFVMNGDRLDDVFAPPSLSDVAGAYAVYVCGVSMEPRYFDGEIVFVNPTKSVRSGDFVIAQIQIDEHGPQLAYVKRFVRWNARELVLAQYNPEREMRFSADQVISVHLVVMGGAV
ncbi:MAG: S24 family peptidase [Pseudomonadota bacterium]